MLKTILPTLCVSIDWLVRQAGRTAALIMPVLALVAAFELFSRYVFGKPTM